MTSYAATIGGRWVATPAGSAGRRVLMEMSPASGTTVVGTLRLDLLSVRVGGRAYDVGRSARDAAVGNLGERRCDNT